jgi:hypothetical protein
VHEQQPERERERLDEKRGASAASRSSRTISYSPLFIYEVHQNMSVREGSRHIELRSPGSRIWSEGHPEKSITVIFKVKPP